MSGDPEQEYLVDGIAEDVLTTLSKIQDLLVIARNSSFVFKGQARDIREIGRVLGARYVLEGSVRKAGNRVRLAAADRQPERQPCVGRPLRGCRR